jgi:DNA-binding HxlR family transcriptional regulator
MPEEKTASSTLHGIKTTLQAIGGKWKPVILYILLRDGTKRFSELKQMIPGIQQAMLTSHLRELERDGLINRVVYHEVPLKVEYSLTEHGQSLHSVLSPMCGWGFKHSEFLSTPRLEDK